MAIFWQSDGSKSFEIVNSASKLSFSTERNEYGIPQEHADLNETSKIFIFKCIRLID